MFRSAAALLIIFLSLPAFSADSRAERWKIRVDRLKKIQSGSSAARVDKTLIDSITGAEIKSAEEFLSLLERYKIEDGSLKSDTKKYPLTEIEKKVKEISFPAISLYYMNELYKTAGDNSIKEKISADITRYASERLGSSVKISQSESGAMAEQYIMEKGLAEFDTAQKIAVSDILSKTEYELSRSDYNSNDTDIIRVIRKSIEDSLTAKKMCEYRQFDEKYLIPVPQWKFIMEQYTNSETRNKAVIAFVYAGGGSLEKKDLVKDINTAEDEIFIKAKSKISRLLQETTPGSGAAGNNPYYEIPDVQKLGSVIDEIDKYRKNLMANINGNENKELVSRLKGNNTGIAARGINRIEAQFRSEEMRIDHLKKAKGDMIIYNEELFKASKSHFYNVREEIYRYADLSAQFLEVLYSSGKNDPQKYIESHNYRAGRYLTYISFAEKLTANTATLSSSGSVKFHSLYKGSIQRVLASSKGFLKPESIPSEIRATLNRDNLKEYASINADYRTKGTQIINAVRKNYEESIAGFSKAAVSKKESAMMSESQIAQDETDRLFSFAKKCSDTLSAMNYTKTALQKYKDEYSRVSENLKKGIKTEGFTGKNDPETFLGSVPGFNPESIEKETGTRDLLAKEGMEALSGSISLVQFYKRKGFPVKFSPSDEEIVSMKRIFSEAPEIIVSSWKMNGKNFRQIDLNISAELKKIINKNAWNGSSNSSKPEILIIEETGIRVSFTPPSGWKKLPDSTAGHNRKIRFESPDMKGIIELTTVCEDQNNLQALAGLWPEKSGFSMVEKNWGKKDNSDFIKSTAKNRYDGVMESYMVASKGYVVILSGKTTGILYRPLNKTLAEIFKNLEISESSM